MSKKTTAKKKAVAKVEPKPVALARPEWPVPNREYVVRDGKLVLKEVST